ncbi:MULTISPECIES: hypothetical protein [unclassified Corynebacterium]|uniref:hypothetical protein n=1 Tax=unclassified Corynebacterium TaxID=2624378 RepID=UPI0008A60493|nr:MULTISPECIES: hypothetical protein [unclassified Corynebacterium]OFP34628.1 hypothetical protein HMPREF2990_00780 [Corynebacterium sp. HMSC071B10]OHF36849.1 hypothetical protein HMPREF2550_06400 [Corynebacterium sp. HMSC074A01]
MIWREHTLYRGQDAVADVDVDGDRDVLRFGCHTLRFRSMNPAHLRAESADGEEFAVRKRSLTVSRYTAHCGDRDYTLTRVGMRGRREIRDAAGELCAVTTPKADGSLEVELHSALTLDLVFITWSLTYVDAAVRRTYY